MASIAIPLTPPCYLLNLPPELRLHVYEYVFSGRPYSCLDIEGLEHISLDIEISPRLPHVAGLLSTCRLIRTEAEAILYASTLFRIDVYNYSKDYVSSGDIDLGVLRSCRLIRHIRQMVLNVWIGTRTRGHHRPLSSVVTTLNILVDVLGTATGGKLAVRKININLRQEGEADVLFQALMPLRSTCHPEVRMGDKGSVSEEVVGRLVRTMTGKMRDSAKASKTFTAS